MTRSDHMRRIATLMLTVLLLLTWRAGRAEVLSADGLRYTAQARRIAAGDWRGGLVGSVDHPMYPLQIAGVQTLVGLPDNAVGWQNAAWTASVIHGVLLVIPLYWVAKSLFGDASAWLGVAAFYAIPHTSQILADALSESVFLHFWCWSLAFALAFLTRGHPGWLLGLAIAAGGAYWTRPEGLLICLSLGLTILIAPLLRSTRVDWPRLGRVLALLAVATGALSLPVILSRGTLGTKPAVAKVLGLRDRSAPHAVERERPLEPGQTEAETWANAGAAFYRAIRQAASVPGLALALAGILMTPIATAAAARRAILIGLILSLSALALTRLHATQGYCAPRHTLVPAQILLLAAGQGLYLLIARGGDWASRRLPAGFAMTAQPGPVPYLAVALLWGIAHAEAFSEPIGHGALGYRMAGDFLAERLAPDEPLIDLSGWASFYADRPGYGFARLHEITPENPSRFLVLRKAHLMGPWDYCERMRALARDAELVAQFPSGERSRTSEVRVYERRTSVAGKSAIAPVR